VPPPVKGPQWLSNYGASARVTTKILEALTSVTSQVDRIAVQHIIATNNEKKVKNATSV